MSAMLTTAARSALAGAEWLDMAKAQLLALGWRGAAIGAAALILGYLVGRLAGRRSAVERIAHLKRSVTEIEAERDSASSEALAAKLKSEGVEGRLDRYVARLSAAISGEALNRPTPTWIEPPWERIGESKIPIIAVANLKGGVGKTTLAGNLGAFLADRDPASVGLGLRVLFIDLDFQGSMSQTMDAVSGAPNANRAPRIFAPDADYAKLILEAGSFDHRRLSRSSFFDCDAASAQFEERLFFEWAIAEAPDRDLRLALAEFLYSPAVQENFDAVVMDLPPRNTVFAYAAYMAATDLVTPIRPDTLSGETATQFIAQLDRSREKLWPNLSFAGFVANITESAELTPWEADEVGAVLSRASQAWSGPGGARLLGVAPRLSAVAAAAGRRFAYFEEQGGGHELFARIGQSVLDHLSYELEPAKKD